MKTSYSSNFRWTFSVMYDVFPVTLLRLISLLILNLLLVIVNNKIYYILGKYLRNAFNGTGLQKNPVWKVIIFTLNKYIIMLILINRQLFVIFLLAFISDCFSDILFLFLRENLLIEFKHLNFYLDIFLKLMYLQKHQHFINSIN